MDKEMERQMLKMNKQLKNIQALIESTHHSDETASYIGEYYIDNVIQTASEIMGD
ncbi:hypothetical protein ACED96_11595 [Clostridium thermobutyricum]